MSGILRIVVAVVVLVGVVPVSVYSIMLGRTEPVTFPIDLHLGKAISPSFRIFHATGYDIELVEDPSGNEAPVSYSWVLKRAGATVASGRSADVLPRTPRQIGSFDAERGRSFVLEVSSLGPAATNTTRSAIDVKVKMKRGGAEEYLWLVGLLSSTGVIALGLGACGLLVVLLAKKLAA